VVRLTVNQTINEGQIDSFQSIARTMTEGSQSEPVRWGMNGLQAVTASVSSWSRPMWMRLRGGALPGPGDAPVGIQSLRCAMCVHCCDFYGDPGPKVTEIASEFGAVIFPYWIGINR
jgi:hypothetical protein